MLEFSNLVSESYQLTIYQQDDVAAAPLEEEVVFVAITLVDKDGCFVAQSFAKLSKVFLSVIEKPLDTGNSGNSGSDPSGWLIKS